MINKKAVFETSSIAKNKKGWPASRLAILSGSLAIAAFLLDR